MKHRKQQNIMLVAKSRHISFGYTANENCIWACILSKNVRNNIGIYMLSIPNKYGKFIQLICKAFAQVLCTRIQEKDPPSSRPTCVELTI